MRSSIASGPTAAAPAPTLVRSKRAVTPGSQATSSYGPVPIWTCDNASLSRPIPSGTIEANGIASTFRKVRSGWVNVNRTVRSSSASMPVACSASPASTASAPSMMDRNAGPMGDGVGVTSGRSSRSNDQTTSAAVTSRSAAPSCTNGTPSRSVNV